MARVTAFPDRVFSRKAPKAIAEDGATIRAGLRFWKGQNSFHPRMLFIRYQANGEKEN
jgi:hypothetical protein